MKRFTQFNAAKHALIYPGTGLDFIHADVVANKLNRYPARKSLAKTLLGMPKGEEAGILLTFAGMQTRLAEVYRKGELMHKKALSLASVSPQLPSATHNLYYEEIKVEQLEIMSVPSLAKALSNLDVTQLLCYYELSLINKEKSVVDTLYNEWRHWFNMGNVLHICGKKQYDMPFKITVDHWRAGLAIHEVLMLWDKVFKQVAVNCRSLEDRKRYWAMYRLAKHNVNALSLVKSVDDLLLMS